MLACGAFLLTFAYTRCPGLRASSPPPPWPGTPEPIHITHLDWTKNTEVRVEKEVLLYGSLFIAEFQKWTRSSHLPREKWQKKFFS